MTQGRRKIQEVQWWGPKDQRAPPRKRISRNEGQDEDDDDEEEDGEEGGADGDDGRSEERRGGKEGRARDKRKE